MDCNTEANSVILLKNKIHLTFGGQKAPEHTDYFTTSKQTNTASSSKKADKADKDLRQLDLSA